MKINGVSELDIRKSPGFNPKNVRPNDIVAKRVVYDEGDHYNPNVKSNTHCFSTSPLPMKNIKSLPHHVLNDPNFKDLTGSKKGYFTVLGLFDAIDYNKWVLRCSCGNYEIRTTKTWNKITDKIDETRCQGCLDCERLRQREYFKLHGTYPWHKKR